MTPPLKIILIEDNPEYRRVIKIALDRTTEFDLVAKFGTAEKALRDLQSDSNLKEADLILLDLNLPKMSGIESIPWLKKYAPDAKIIILTQSEDHDDILNAIQQGAAGYLLKSSTMAQIHEAIQTVHQGGASLDSGVASHILSTLQKRLPQPSTDNPTLSKREQDVLVLLGEGLVKKEIADRLSISSHTVATHVRHIYDKLDALNAPSAISAAYKKGLLPLDPKEDEQ